MAAPGSVRVLQRAASSGFAQGGGPGHPGLPEWAAFETGARQTMILGPERALASDPSVPSARHGME